ncbi:PQQ-binding-like beta-propeller repeat protein [Paenibacillus xylanexedens]|uniref:outer membrane protein assembly factor BamB family protein n=1 Tax=Paenibacillus xylanexedens TaxID=528191 RepID=UPI001C92FBF1|nr:PQQ-binding-like beta-propeller repeat protein [Paenibacillus xylanexedens]
MKTGPDWQRTGYKWITMTGLSAVLLTGWMLLDSKMVVLGGQASATTPQALGASPQASSTQLVYKQGEPVTLMTDIPLFKNRREGSVAADQMGIEYYTTKSEKYTLASVRGEWIQLKSSEQGDFWLPSWYALKGSRSMTKTAPQSFTLQSGSKLYLAPGSASTWSFEKRLTDKAVIVAAWDGWYGVSIAPRIWNKESSTYRPVLLWIKEKDIDHRMNVADGWLDQEVSLQTSVIRHLTDIKLNKATTSNQVAEWLGEPDWKESSSNLNYTGYSMSIGQTWRYEREDGQYLVTFNKNGKVVRTRWNLPQDNRNAVVSDWNISRADEYGFTTKIYGTTLPTTIPWKPLWTNQGDINYTFLQAATDDVLLMKGDDGGFSGDYHEGSIYALDRHSGQQLWRINGGFGRLQAELETGRQYVTIYSDYDPDKKKYVERIRHLNLKNGKVTWTYTPKQNFSLNGITAAKNVVVVNSPINEGSSNSKLTVLDSANGKTLWTRKLTTGYELLNKSADDPYVLYWEKNKLVAADPQSGRTAWSLKAKRSTIEQLGNDPYFDGIERLNPFATTNAERWISLDNQWLLVDLNTGKKLVQFPARAGQRFEVLNDGMLLIRENKNGDHYGKYEDFTTTLYDAKTGKARWTLKGKVERGLVEEDQLYVIKNGYPAALDYKTGETRWSAKDSIATLRYPTNQGSYLIIDDQLLLPMDENLLVLNKRNGALLGRVHDVVMGSPEHRERDAKNGTINRIGNEVFVGSSNGRFRVYEASRLQEAISP